jgi:type I restriction enzyme, S subunit
MNLPNINISKLDKSLWKSHRFDEVANSVSERVEPAESAIDRYIGLEHVDAENIHITRFGSKSDVKGQKLKCYPGDIIFGKRRAYQRKAAVVTEEAICSAHSFVLRANPEVIDPKLFPFFLHSDQFMNRAIDISVGGLSPTINWGTLKEQDFLLPPKDQQAKLAELLWAMDEVIEKEIAVFEKQLCSKMSAERSVLLGERVIGPKKRSPYGLIPEEWQLISLFDLRDPNEKYSFTGGPFGSNLKSEHYTETGVRVLQLQNIGAGRFLGDYKIYTSQDKADELRSCNIYPGEIILAKMAPVARCSIIPDTEDRYLMCSDGIRLKVDSNKYDKKFVFHAINTSHFLRYAESKSTGSTRGRIALGDLKKIPIVIPRKMEIQQNLTKIMNSFEMTLYKVEDKIKCSKTLQKSLINQVFS